MQGSRNSSSPWWLGIPGQSACLCSDNTLPGTRDLIGDNTIFIICKTETRAVRNLILHIHTHIYYIYIYIYSIYIHTYIYINI